MARGEWMRGLRQFLLRPNAKTKRPASPGQAKSLGVRKHDSLALSYGNHHGFLVTWYFELSGALGLL